MNPKPDVRTGSPDCIYIHGEKSGDAGKAESGGEDDICGQNRRNKENYP